MDQQIYTLINSLDYGISLLSNIEKEFTRYENGKLISFYNNYLDYCITTIFDDGCLDEFIKEYCDQHHFLKGIQSKLFLLSNKLDEFYEECKDMDDFTLLRRPEWEEIIPLAKECSEELNKILESNPKISSPKNDTTSFEDSRK